MSAETTPPPLATSSGSSSGNAPEACIKVVVTGATGLLGRAVVQHFHQLGGAYQVVPLGWTRASSPSSSSSSPSSTTPSSSHPPPPSTIKLDLTDEDALARFLAHEQPDAIVHCAAERRPDVVERDPDASEALNVAVPTHLARWCASFQPSSLSSSSSTSTSTSAEAGAEAGAEAVSHAPLLLNLSTDYVFDGTRPPYGVDDAPNPLNAYGVSKLRAERALSEHGAAGRAVSVRVPVLYGRAERDDESAVNVLLGAIRSSQGEKRGQVKMDAYAVRYPTNVADVARALADLVAFHCCSPSGSDDAPAQPAPRGARKALPPTLHFSAREAMTKYDMCHVLCRVWNSVHSELLSPSSPSSSSLSASLGLEDGSREEPEAGTIATTTYLDPEYAPDPGSSTSRPRHCKLDLSALSASPLSAGAVHTECVSFEGWWRDYLREREEHRLRAEAEARRRARARAEAEAKAKAEAEAKARAEAEAEAKARAEAEAKAKAEAEEEEERRRKEEQKRQAEEAEAAARKQKELEEAAAAEAAEVERKRKEEAGADERAAGDEKDAAAEPKEAKEDGAEGTSASTAATAAAVAAAAAASAAAPSGGSTAEADREAEDELRETTSGANNKSPSFSSLRARPTPPATSPSPEDSEQLPPSVLSLGASDAPTESMTRRSSTVDSTSAPLAADSLDSKAAAAIAKSASAQSKKGDDVGSLPATLLQRDDSLVGTDKGIADGGDGDSDGYGQPSPRVSAVPNFIRTEPSSEGGAEQASSYAGVQSHSAKSAVQSTINAVDRQLADASMRDDAIVAPLPKRYTFEIKVGDPQKVGDPVTAHIVYTVRTKTDSANFRAHTFSVLRRYSDFRWLHAALVHNNPGVVVPPVPEKVKIGRFAPELVEARRHGLETCINKIVNHSLLQEDDDLKLFLESDNFSHDVKLRDIRKGPVPTPEQKTYFGWSSNLGGPKFVESDEWFERQRAYLDSLESQLKHIVKAINTLAQQRKDFAAATSDFSSSMMVLSTSSLSRAVSTCFAGLGEVERRAHEIAEVQSDADVREIGTVIYEYERVVGSVRVRGCDVCFELH